MRWITFWNVFEKEECLEFVETLETEDNIEKKLQKKGKMDSNWNFAENVDGVGDQG